MTMKMIDEMAQMVKWGGQVAVTEMMNDYVKAQTGRGMDPIANNGTDSAAARIVV